MIIPGPLEMKNSTQNTPPWQFSELYHLCNNNLKNDLFASPLNGFLPSSRGDSQPRAQCAAYRK